MGAVITLPPGGLGTVLHGVAGQLQVGLFQRRPVRRHLGERHLPAAEQCRDPLRREPGDGEDAAGGSPTVRDGGYRIGAS